MYDEHDIEKVYIDAVINFYMNKPQLYSKSECELAMPIQEKRQQLPVLTGHLMQMGIYKTGKFVYSYNIYFLFLKIIWWKYVDYYYKPNFVGISTIGNRLYLLKYLNLKTRDTKLAIEAPRQKIDFKCV